MRPGASTGTAHDARTPAPAATARIAPTLRQAAARLDEARHAIAEALHIAESDHNTTGEKKFHR
jgi:hypothetical protein